MISKNFIATAFSAFATLTAFAAAPQVGTGEIDGYKLVWQDLFDATELNMNRWNIEVNGSGGGNNELQYYTARKQNVSLGDDGKGNGCLILTARKEIYNGKSATSGRITSMGKIAFKHGKIEAAIKLPKTANGLWPAFWMMGNDFSEVGWPRCFELDIMEFGHQDGIRKGTQDRFFNGAYHWGTAWNDHRQYAKHHTNSYSLQDDEFHLYTVYWDNERISMYVDQDKYPDVKPYCEMTIPITDDKTAPGYYFHKEGFILFNLAVGGNFPGIWDINGITALNEGNDFQQSMYVNYVKVYQKGTSDESSSFSDPGDMDTDPDGGVADLSQSGLEIKVVGTQVVLSEAANVQVYSTTGSVIDSAYNADRLDLSGVAKGVYIVKAVSDKGNKSVSKIIID